MVREIAKAELIKAGETETGLEQIGEPSDQWTSISLNEKESVALGSK
jgi:hypothetical protein